MKKRRMIEESGAFNSAVLMPSGFLYDYFTAAFYPQQRTRSAFRMPDHALQVRYRQLKIPTGGAGGDK